MAGFNTAAFTAPVADIAYLAKLFGLDQLEADGLVPELADGLAEAGIVYSGEEAAPLGHRVSLRGG